MVPSAMPAAPAMSLVVVWLSPRPTKSRRASFRILFRVGLPFLMSEYSLTYYPIMSGRGQGFIFQGQNRVNSLAGVPDRLPWRLSCLRNQQFTGTAGGLLSDRSFAPSRGHKEG